MRQFLALTALVVVLVLIIQAAATVSTSQAVTSSISTRNAVLEAALKE